MNNTQAKLQEFIYESIHPKTFTGKTITLQEFEKWRNFVTIETNLVKRSLLNRLEVSGQSRYKRLVIFTNQLVVLSNVINAYIFKYYSIYKTHHQAGHIKSHYNFSLKAVEDLIGYSVSLCPERVNEIQISNARLPQVITSLKEKRNKVAAHLQERGINKNLIEIVISGITQLITRKYIREIDTSYTTSLLDILNAELFFDTETLVDLLLINDFNVPEFFLYCVNLLREKTNEIPGLHEHREMLLTEKDRLYNLALKKGLRMPDMCSTLLMNLDQFLAEKSAFVKQLVKIRREVIRDSDKRKAMSRFLIYLSVPQLALFIRMQIEKGLLAKENLKELFTFFSTFFYTPNTMFISAENLLKKSTDVDFSTAQKMKKHLIGMLNWLNTNFNLSNYN
jgi:hypothetical protein